MKMVIHIKILIFFNLFFTLYDYNNDNSDIKVIITVFFMSASFI